MERCLTNQIKEPERTINISQLINFNYKRKYVHFFAKLTPVSISDLIS